MQKRPDPQVIVIGGGAAGMMAAACAARTGTHVLLLEKNEKLGKKLYITGKGRCNFTNRCAPEDFFQNVPRNARFLYSAVYGFDPEAAIDWFEERGLRTKTERGNRVFPASDHASDVTRTLQRELEKLGVDVRLNTQVKRLCMQEAEPGAQETEPGARNAQEKGLRLQEAEPDTRAGGVQTRKSGGKDEKPQFICGVELTDGSRISGQCVIVATGGLSYPSTGSTGDGYRFAGQAGHTVLSCSPSLVPMNVLEEDLLKLQGLSLRNVRLTILDGKKKLFDEFGEMLFTHFGISGPLVLSASARVQKQLSEHPLTARVDLKPALDDEELDARILRAFSENPNKVFRNALSGLFPARLIPVIVERSGIDPECVVHDITRAQRQKLAQITRAFTFTLTALRGYNEAVITRGGVAVKEVDPATMQSRRIRGLYFAGEVLDVDAMTGGFNLQIAWSTGYAAGFAAGESIRQEMPGSSMFHQKTTNLRKTQKEKTKKEKTKKEKTKKEKTKKEKTNSEMFDE